MLLLELRSLVTGVDEREPLGVALVVGVLDPEGTDSGAHVSLRERVPRGEFTLPMLVLPRGIQSRAAAEFLEERPVLGGCFKGVEEGDGLGVLVRLLCFDRGLFREMDSSDSLIPLSLALFSPFSDREGDFFTCLGFCKP